MCILKTMARVVVMVALVILLQSCKEDKLGDPIIVSNVEKEFYLDLSETLNPIQRLTNFHVRTIEDGNCLNGEVDVRFKHSGNHLTFSVHGVLIPEDCIPGIVPFQSDIEVGFLDIGFYLFNFDLRNTVINSGSLLVEDNRYLLNLETEEGVIILHKEVFRVPEKTIWGYFAYEEPSQDAAVQEMIGNFTAIGEVPNLEKGYYGYFTINVTPEGIEITDAPETSYLYPFIYSYDGNWNEIKGLAGDFIENYPLITLKLFDDTGRVF